MLQKKMEFKFSGLYFENQLLVFFLQIQSRCKPWIYLLKVLAYSKIGGINIFNIFLASTLYPWSKRVAICDNVIYTNRLGVQKKMIKMYPAVKFD